MTSIERTAYPRFGRLVSARELSGLSPSSDERLWARGLARSDAHLLGLVLSLKCFQRLGSFPRRDDVPDAVVDHAAEARSEASDLRAARAEEAARDERARAAEKEAAMSRLEIEIAKARAGMESADQRAASAERLLEQVGAELQAERDRHDVSLSQLHEQLAQLIARTPARRPATKAAPAAKRSAPKSATKS